MAAAIAIRHKAQFGSNLLLVCRGVGVPTAVEASNEAHLALARMARFANKILVF